MFAAIFQFVVSTVFIVGAAIGLAKFADVIARRTRLGRLLVGSLFLAAATSLPELTIDMSAVLMGTPDIALGGLVGSNLFNLLILAVADLLHRSRGRLLSRVAATHALSGTISIALTALVGVAIFVESRVTGVSVGWIGVSSVVIGVAYIGGMRLVFFDQRAAAEKLEMSEHAQPTAAGMTLKMALLGYGIATGVILLLAPFLAASASDIAKLSRLGDTFIGTTLVALATSLPEFVATLAALRMRAVDLAIGNIFGSNAINMFLIIPLDLAAPGPLLSEVSTTHVLTCLSVCLVTSIAILGQLYRVERRILFIEPDAALIMALVITSLWLIYVTG